MNAPITHESTSIARTEKEEALSKNAQMHLFIGTFLDLVLAILALYTFPRNGVEQVDAVAQAATEKAEKNSTPYANLGLRVVVFAAILLGTWWVTEAIPLAATTLLPLVIFSVSQAAEFEDAAAPYASDTILLFMDGFMFALAMQEWNLYRKITLGVVLPVGTKPRQLILGFMIITGFLSMWVSNAATVVVTLPIGMPALTFVAGLVGGMDKAKRFVTALVLSIVYSTSIGSAATIIDTPPNAFLVAYLVENRNINIGLGQWMLVGAPLALILLFLAWQFMVFVMFRPKVGNIPGRRELVLQQRKELGRMSRGKITVVVIFVLTAFSWVFMPIPLGVTGSTLSISDPLIVMIAAAPLFLTPMDVESGKRLLDWKTTNGLPWDVLLLFGGDLSLPTMFSKLSLSLWTGEQTRGPGTLPILVIVAAVATSIIFLTELTSSTATAAAFPSIMGGAATGIGVTAENPANILLLVAPVALAATFAFMPPVAAPPNVVVHGSGHIKIGDMAKMGLWLNIAGVTLITVVVLLIGVPVFGLTP